MRTRSFGAVLAAAAGFLLVPAFASAEGKVRSTFPPAAAAAQGEGFKVTLFSGGKPVATLFLSHSGGKLGFEAGSSRTSSSRGITTTHLSGKVSLHWVRDGKQILQLAAEEATLEYPTQRQQRQPPQEPPGK